MPPRVELGYGAGAVPETAEPGSGPAHAALPGEGVIEVEGPEDESGDAWPEPPAGEGDGAEGGRADAGAQPAEMPGGAPPPPPPPPRTKWTRRVPHHVLIGHAASLTPY